MKRRQAMQSLAGLCAWGTLTTGVLPSMARAQAEAEVPEKPPFRIATIPDLNLHPKHRALLVKAMQERGWEHGRDYSLPSNGIRPFSATTDEQIKQVVATQPDLIITVFLARRIQRITTTTPIVMVLGQYPIEEGVALTLARPGKNVTGNAMYVGVSMWAKLVELLQDLKPGIRQVTALLADPLLQMMEDTEGGMHADPESLARVDATIRSELRQAETALGLKISLIETRQRSTDQILNHLATTQPDAILFIGLGTLPMREQVMAYANKRRIPTIDGFTSTRLPESLYPLLFHRPVDLEFYRSAADYMIRILRSAAPGDLPIQPLTRYHIVLNKKAARAIGMEIPPSVLLRVGEVIE